MGKRKIPDCAAVASEILLLVRVLDALPDDQEWDRHQLGDLEDLRDEAARLVMAIDGIFDGLTGGEVPRE